MKRYILYGYTREGGMRQLERPYSTYAEAESKIVKYNPDSWPRMEVVEVVAQATEIIIGSSIDMTQQTPGPVLEKPEPVEAPIQEPRQPGRTRAPRPRVR